jgi:proline iminopeptidase
MTGENAGWVNVGRAEIYWETTGNPMGIPVLFLHGGPGAPLGRGYRTLHDAAQFWTIGLDQRGCGRSIPAVQDDLANLSANTTQALIEDIEAVRRHLGVEKWIVTGGSWGSTLALAYALEHPARLYGIAVAAVTTTSRDEVQWITEGVGRIFPEAWEEFSKAAKCRPGGAGRGSLRPPPRRRRPERRRVGISGLGPMGINSHFLGSAVAARRHVRR